MRRLLYWYVPLAVALLAAVVFATGFSSFMRGDIGTPVDVGPPPRPQASAPPSTIVPIILGDSVARGTGDETGLGIGGRFVDNLRRRRIGTKDIVNLAVNGARTADLRQQLEHENVRTLIGESNAIIISIGGNDLWADNMRSAPARDPEPVMNEVLERISELVKTVRAANPRARIYVIGLYNPFTGTPVGNALTPLVVRWNGRLAQRFAGDPNIVVVQTSDLFEWRDRLSVDRFHPSGEGYELIARRIADTF